jgi:hypothetical protein
MMKRTDYGLGLLALAAIILGTFLFLARGDLGEARERAADLQTDLGSERDRVVTLEAEIEVLETDVVEAQDAMASAEQITGQVQQILSQARRCSYHLLTAVDAVDGAFGTEDWGRFYSSIDLAVPFCQRAAEDAGFGTF